MRAAHQFNNPNDLDATITIVATVGEFREAKKQIERIELRERHWPLGGILEALDNVISEADKRFVTTVDKPKSK